MFPAYQNYNRFEQWDVADEVKTVRKQKTTTRENEESTQESIDHEAVVSLNTLSVS